MRRLNPVADRLAASRSRLRKQRWLQARERNDYDAAIAGSAWDEMEALQLFKRDMGSFGRVYTFLSQIFDYGNTAMEKRAIFLQAAAASAGIWPRAGRRSTFRKVVLTHHTSEKQGKRP